MGVIFLGGAAKLGQCEGIESIEMDLWVAAAAGAGYLVTCWQNTSKENEEGLLKPDMKPTNEKSALVSSSMDKQVVRKRTESGSCPFRRLIQRQAAEGISSNSEGGHSESLPADVSQEEIASCSRVDGDRSVSSGEFVRDNSSLLSLQPWIFRKENCREDGENVKGNSGFSNKYCYDMDDYANDLHSQLSPRKASLGYGFGRSRNSLRSRRSRRNSVKPLSSIENCLIPQLYKDHFEFEEHVFGPLPSPASPAIRPFIITDGNRIISKSSYNPSGIEFENGLCGSADGVIPRVGETVVGVPPLPESRKLKPKSAEMQHGRLYTSDSRQFLKTFHLQGSLEGMLLFCLGISIGVMSTILSNKREVDKLNDLLKNTENLVQDLQEELEMKDLLIVKELPGDACENQEPNDNSALMEERFASFHNQPPDLYPRELKIDELDQPHISMVGENSESMSKIEAELEAELERLELNMNASSLGGRMSALAELDPDLVAEVVQGELKAYMLNGRSGGCHSESDRDTSGNSTTHTHRVDYSVSPRELRLRLHELVQSRLEERIKELETALYHNQKQLHFLEAERVNSERDYSNSERGSLSNLDSPTTMEQGQATDHPLCLNLSGDALDAYNEAYEEFIQIAETEEENPLSTTTTSEPISGKILCPSNQSLPWVQEGDRTDGSLPKDKIYERESAWKQIFRSRSNEMPETEEDEDEDINDEEGRILIQQIVEKTRQGSPVIVNAQRILFRCMNN